ncbi:hypothetical protein ONZ43_g4577 [Nemania bipapillata]|uniref:Uncharacterized protein n=1 Tax=Nemania bipapillata TaxID=110536 RepID=A0ACC2IL16_9PEZI|nr:hypothetical protein ONZ43_g4577 [Nemania bipapillata]
MAAELLSVNLDEWKLATEIGMNETRHPSFASPIEIWKRDNDSLGRGGFGEVWKETTSSLLSGNRANVRAVKRIRKTEKSTPELPNMIRLSTRKYSSLDHLQHFVEFFGWFEDQHHIYISMEYVPNGDLQHHIQERYKNEEGFQEFEGALIVKEIAKALKFMHEKKVMHRDLKPALASAQTKAGTDGYMAPEVADTNRKMPYTMAADIWSLGAVTYCIQTGKPPFQDILAVGRYIDGKGAFPFDLLLRFSGRLVIFIIQLMDIVSTRRPTVDEVLAHEWLKPEDGEVVLEEEIQIPDHGDWSAEPSIIWDFSAEEIEEESQDSSSPAHPSRPRSPHKPNDMEASIIQQPHNLAGMPPSSLLNVHHTAPYPVVGTDTFVRTPPLRPSSSPPGNVERDLLPTLMVNSRPDTCVEKFRDLQNMDRKEFTSSLPPLNQPDIPRHQKAPEKDPEKAPEKAPWPLQHGDSGYSTSSAMSAPSPSLQKSEAISPAVEQEQTPGDNYAAYFGLHQFLELAERQKQPRTTPIEIAKQHHVIAKLDKDEADSSSRVDSNQTEHILIDLTDSNASQAPSSDRPNLPAFGPWLPDQFPDHNPWAESGV